MSKSKENFVRYIQYTCMTNLAPLWCIAAWTLNQCNNHINSLTAKQPDIQEKRFSEDYINFDGHGPYPSNPKKAETMKFTTVVPQIWLKLDHQSFQRKSWKSPKIYNQCIKGNWQWTTKTDSNRSSLILTQVT